MPTALRPLRLRSSRAHSDRKPAVEVQQCRLRAEVGGRRACRRVGKAEVDMEVAEVDLEVDAEVVEEKEEKEKEKEKNNSDKI